jgi:hypothetical protein
MNPLDFGCTDLASYVGADIVRVLTVSHITQSLANELI